MEKTILTTAKGKTVRKLTTEEFAKLLLDSPGIVFGFTTTLADQEEVVLNTTNAWPNYSIVSARLFDAQSIFINRDCVGGGAPFTFDIPSFDWNLVLRESESLYEKCTQEIVDGLVSFNLEYGELPDVWYITEDIGELEIVYTAC